MSEYRKTMEYQLGKLRLISAAHETLRKWLEEVAEGRKLQAVFRREFLDFEEYERMDQDDERVERERKEEYPFLRDDLVIQGRLLCANSVEFQCVHDGSGSTVALSEGRPRQGKEFYLLEDGGLLVCDVSKSFFRVYDSGYRRDNLQYHTER
jgi:hypothetical protein